MINLLKYLILVVVFVHGTDACCCAETTSVFPRVEVTTQQKNALLILADYLERLPCEERTECIYNMTEPPIQLDDSQLVGLAQRFKGSFQVPSDTGECQEPPYGKQIEHPRPSRKRRATEPETAVCRATVEANQRLFIAYNRNGELVYIPQPTTNNGFQMSQLFYESVCLDADCFGPTCSCSTKMIPTSTSVVLVIRGNANTFTEQTIMTRSCQAVI